MLRAIWLRKALLLAAGVGFAITAHLAGPDPRDRGWLATQVKGESLTAKGGGGRSDARRPAASPRPRKTDQLIGDALLRGDISLGSARLRNDRYEVKLADKSRAILTLDPKLQEAAEKVLARAKAPVGAIVVMSTDGRILALAGRRNEPNLVERAWDVPVTTWAPAASIFKLVTAAALVEGGVAPDAEVCYHGGLRSVDMTNLADDPRRDGQCANLTYAVSKSQNAIIAKLAHKHLDKTKLSRVARKFGFATAPTFALDCEASRLDLPDEPLQFARAAAGFWSSELSPLGGALVANVIATKGMAVTPRIVDAIRSPDGAQRPVQAAPAERAIDAAVAQAVSDMMVDTCETGTARVGFRDGRGRKFFDAEVAGKTGSLTRTKPSYLHYSWFVGFAPADNPQVSIAVLLGNPRKWYLKAHTAARMVLDEMF